MMTASTRLPLVDGHNIPRGQDIPPRAKDTDPVAEARGLPQAVTCEICDLPGVDNSQARNIVVCLDGISNGYSEFNTNVYELSLRVIRDDRQILYYIRNGGIGTYIKPTWHSFSYYIHELNNLAIAWDFEGVIFKVYDWLCTQYRSGDRIYLFGSGRGAYQVRVLAAMIAQIGLLHTRYMSQLPAAFNVYAGLKSGPDRAQNQKVHDEFKMAFSREAPVHFVGTWETVPSVGLARDKNMPGMDEFNEHVCYFRHALALDEQRVKLLPEYICCGESDTTPRTTKNGAPRVKEVWFAGCHSDIVGGNISNTELNIATIPLLWMANEARVAGLRLHRSRVKWQMDKLKNIKPTESLSWFWRLLEILPISRLSYTGCQSTSTTRIPHLSEGRVVKPGQKIHASVAFIQDYTPRATLAHADMELTWDNIVGTGTLAHHDWTRDVLELDLFDLESVAHIVYSVNSDLGYTDYIERLQFLALTREGAEAIIALKSALVLLSNLLQYMDRFNIAISLLLKLVPRDAHRHTIMCIELVRSLQMLSESSLTSLRLGAITVLRSMAKNCDVFPLPDEKPNKVAADLAGPVQDDTSHLALLYLASIRLFRYQRSKKHADWAAAERSLQAALAKLPISNPDWPFVQNGFATVIEARATIPNIESSIAARRRIMDNAQARDTSIFRPRLAESLMNLATLLSANAIRPEDALQATQDAVGLYRQLSDEDHATFDPDLAMSLNNLCNRFAGLGNLVKGLEAIDEAVALYQRLDESSPSSFEVNLVTSLKNRVGRLEEALKAAKEAVKLHRVVAATGGSAGRT